MMNDGLTLHLKCQGFTQTAATAIRPQPIAKMILLRMDREIPLRTARSSGIPNKKSHSDDKPNNRNSTRNWIVATMTYKLRQKHTDLILIAGNDQPQNSVAGHHAAIGLGAHRGSAWSAQGGRRLRRPRGQSAAALLRRRARYAIGEREGFAPRIRRGRREIGGVEEREATGNERALGRGRKAGAPGPRVQTIGGTMCPRGGMDGPRRLPSWKQCTATFFLKPPFLVHM